MEEQPTYAPRFYSPRVIAGLLGVTDVTVRRYINDGKLPATRIGRTIRIKEEDYIKFVEPNHE